MPRPRDHKHFVEFQRMMSKGGSRESFHLTTLNSVHVVATGCGTTTGRPPEIFWWLAEAGPGCYGLMYLRFKPPDPDGVYRWKVRRMRHGRVEDLEDRDLNDGYGYGQAMLRWIAAMLLAAGCAAPPPGAVSAGGAEESPAWILYRCESGREVAAAYPEDSLARVRYAGATYEMRIVRSASGARYAGGGYEWWTRGTGPGATGRLSRFAGEELTASQPVESCIQPSAP